MDSERAWPQRRTASAGSFVVEVFFTPPYTHAPFHVHDQVTVVVPLGGSFVENTLRRSLQGKPGAVIVETPESPHENLYSADGGTNLRLRLSPELQRSVEFEGHGRQGHVRAYTIARRMADAMIDPLSLECAGLEILGYVNNGPDWAPRARPAFLREIVANLRETADFNRDITTLAAGVQVSPIRLVRTFRRVYGISLARYMRVLQAQRALSLLSDPAMSIGAAAAQTGFSDQSHMTRVFVQTYGAPPAALRRQRYARTPLDRAFEKPHAIDSRNV